MSAMPSFTALESSVDLDRALAAWHISHFRITADTLAERVRAIAGRTPAAG